MSISHVGIEQGRREEDEERRRRRGEGEEECGLQEGGSQMTVGQGLRPRSSRGRRQRAEQGILLDVVLPAGNVWVSGPRLSSSHFPSCWLASPGSCAFMGHREHTRLGAKGPEMGAHLISPEDR